MKIVFLEHLGTNHYFLTGGANFGKKKLPAGLKIQK